MRHEPLSSRAKGRWPGILSALGLPSKLLSKKHGPCPMCGGKDRFRFDDKGGAGTFFCTHCGAGDGVKLVMLLKGADFKDAARLIEGVMGDAPVVQPDPVMTDKQKRDAMNRLWLASHPVQIGDPVSLYLRSRVGEIAVPDVIRTVERCRYHDDPVSYHPAMVAMIHDPDGAPCLLHRTYLTTDGRKADVQAQRRLMPGELRPGSAVRLAALGKVLGIAEGIETALAASVLFGVPCWAALNTSMLEQWQAPEGVSEVLVFADHDLNFAGQKAAYGLAFKIASRVRVSVRVPPLAGQDWNDVLRVQAKRGQAA